MLKPWWRNRIAPFLTRFNSHKVLWGGVFIAFASLGAIGGRDAMDSWATAHLDGVASFARAFVDGAATVGLYAIWPAIIAAALGRPPNIPGAPKVDL